MFYSVLFFISIFFYPIFAQSITEDLKQKKTTLHTPLNISILSQSTFSPYKVKNEILNEKFIFRTSGGPQQSKFKVSLVGVNINTWLENPENFTVLERLAREFSVENLLDNLVVYNPKLEFNSPSNVFNALHTDIYSPYLKIIPNRKPLPRYFSTVSNTITFTRNYYIYGAAAQNFPYFGQPIEGKNREINLGILPGQLEEYQVKLPDTDIFLVAVVNISPNWLEEGWDVIQVNRQKLTIRVYAFDKRGKLIGGAGIPQTVFYNDQRFVIEQAVYSRIWQPLISRRFYAWPSFKIVNTPVPGTDRTSPAVVLPEGETPRINRVQKYILKSMKNLQETGQSINIQLLDKQGKYTYKSSTPLKTYRNAFLVKHEVIYKTRKVPKTMKDIQLLSFFPYMIKAQNFMTSNKAEENAKLKKREKIEQSKDQSVFSKKYYPSNEGDKLTSIIRNGFNMLVRSTRVYTNEPRITNSVLPFEKENNPYLYHKKRKKYYSLSLSTRKFVRDFEKETRNILASLSRQQKDRIFWSTGYKKILEDRHIWTDEMEQSRKAWVNIFLEKSMIEQELAKMDRKENLAQIISEPLDKFSSRERQKLQSKYSNKDQMLSLKIAQSSMRISNILKKYQSSVESAKYQNKISSLKKELNAISQEESRLFNEYIAKLPKNIIFSNRTQNPFTSDELQKIVRDNKISGRTVLQIYATHLPPTKKYELQQKKKIVDKRKATNVFYYEGFILGLSGSKSVKTQLKHSMVRL